MFNRKILISVLILICAVLTGCSATPKTVDQFINNYNREIKNALSWHVLEKSVDRYAANCSISVPETGNYPGAVGDAKVCVFHEGMVRFVGFKNRAQELVAELQIHEDTSDNEILAMIDAAILAAGDDYEKVGNTFGYLKNGDYNMRRDYKKRINFNGKEYSLVWFDDRIIFTVTIPK